MDDENAIQRHYSISDGMPTKPDVDLLMRTWPEPKVGDQFDHSSVEKLIGAKWRSARYRTVTDAWRNRMLNDHRCVIEVSAGTGFFVASTDQITAGTRGVFVRAGHLARKQRKKLLATKPEGDLQCATVEHQARLVQNLERETKKLRANSLPSLALKPVPRIEPPQQLAS